MAFKFTLSKFKTPALIIPKTLQKPSIYIQHCTITTNNTNSSPQQRKLTWNEYFDFRRKRRLTERLVTIPTTIGGFGISFAYVASREFDTTLILGQDPLLIYGAGTILCGFTGLIIGPIIGSSIWKLFHRKEVELMEQRDRDFYAHIKKNRADPSLHSLRNPAPDYYGEKIRSVTDYRKWLRKQRDIIRKGTFHIGEGDQSSDI
ncbi:mitochondrial import protein Pam17-domain-containing protein [Glomus cerebriforme]|uniref:Presequence translocated-associated motor subunit PAM17 n=1 Tax=Glomus cerebriforme TaxID=658196 RepID=A0A397TBN3_9GLOM|nr:mitochondrial import protein Pam17-domain-containing protein [Glomus cerebriforme]